MLTQSCFGKHRRKCKECGKIIETTEKHSRISAFTLCIDCLKKNFVNGLGDEKITEEEQEILKAKLFMESI